MSRASKVTFGAACAFTASCIAGVYYMKEVEFQTRRVGIERDDERRAKKRENQAELERQEALRRELEKEQRVVAGSGEGTVAAGSVHNQPNTTKALIS
ncbi:hypothetical protein HK104_009930 [Borealophlyctis nickersoniae]|nr:hypothetical protein HK104_009930 [Borealophlyctis nickersoniae]